MTKSEQKAFDKSWDSRNLARSNLLLAVYFFEAGLKYKQEDNIKIPPQQIVDLYHECLPELRKVIKLSSVRRGHIKARCREDFTSLDSWRKYFSFVGKSEFLMGKVEPTNGHRKLKVDLDWLINESNVVKIIEGKYA